MGELHLFFFGLALFALSPLAAWSLRSWIAMSALVFVILALAVMNSVGSDVPFFGDVSSIYGIFLGLGIYAILAKGLILSLREQFSLSRWISASACAVVAGPALLFFGPGLL